MDIRKVKKLIELLEASSVDEIEIKEGEESVRISRNTGAPIPMAAPIAAPVMPAPVRPHLPRLRQRLRLLKRQLRAQPMQ